MKKFLLSILCLFSIISYATADEAKFDFTQPSELTPSITDDMFTDAGDGAFAFETSATTFTSNGVTLNTTNGSTESRIWKAASGKYDFRVYKTATLTIAAPNGGTITSIAFTGGTVNEFSANVGTVDGKNWTGAATSVVFTWSGSAKTQKINDITVTFSTDGSVTPDQGGEGEGEGEDEGETEVTFTTIAEVLAAGVGNAATKGTVVATYARGFLMSDGTGSILVYQGSDKGAVAGDAVEVVGATSMYGGLLQFGNTAVVTKTGTATVSHPTATAMDGAAMDAYLTAPAIMYVEYTGTLTTSGTYYNVAVEGAATAVGSIQYPQDTIKANLTNGAVVKVTGYTIGVSSSKYVNTMAVKVEVIEGGEEPEEPEVPTEAKEYTVAEAIAAYVDGKQIPAIITGYIVGTIDGQAYTEGCRFSGTAESKTNLLIADNVDETDPAKCMPIQLPSGAVRNALNLVDNPGNYKKEVKLTGSLEKYFGVPGLKTVTKYEIEGATPEEPEVPTEAKEYTVNEALAAYVDGQQIPAIVTGYIVGAMNNTGYVPEFGATTVNTNLLLSDDPEEDAIENCIIVQLPYGDIRTALNLVDHKDYYQKQIKITGSLESYFQQAGLKNPTAYEFTGGTGIEDVILGETATKVIFDITGRRIDHITNPGIYIVNGKKVLVK